MIAGGAQVYAAALPIADEQVLTEVPPEPGGRHVLPATSTGTSGSRPNREHRDGFDHVWWSASATAWQAEAMELRIMTEPQQGAHLRRPAGGRADRRGARLRGVLPRPTTTSGWAPTACPGRPTRGSTLAGLARDTSTIRLGTLMTCATFRLPGPLAIAVAEVDQMSGGRVELRHRRGLVRAPSTRRTASRSRTRAERFDRLEEQLAIITGLWATPPGETFSLRRASTTGSPTRPALPKPDPEPTPAGPASAAWASGARPSWPRRYADEFNLPVRSTRTTTELQFGRVRAGLRGARTATRTA